MYGEFLKPRGKYIGVDVNNKLLQMAREATARRKMALSSIEKQNNRTRGEKRKENLEGKRYYIAGGGDAESYRKAVRRRTRRSERYNKRMRQMIRKEKFCSVSTGPFYVIIGEK